MRPPITLVTATMVSTSPLQKGRSCSAVPWKLYLAMHSVPEGQAACRTGQVGRWRQPGSYLHPPAHPCSRLESLGLPLGAKERHSPPLPPRTLGAFQLIFPHHPQIFTPILRALGLIAPPEFSFVESQGWAKGSRLKQALILSLPLSTPPEVGGHSTALDPYPCGTWIADIFSEDLASPCHRKATLPLGTMRAAGRRGRPGRG